MDKDKIIVSVVIDKQALIDKSIRHLEDSF